MVFELLRKLPKAHRVLSLVPNKLVESLEWRRALLQSMTALWDLHPEGAFFRAQGGNEIPPPVYCSLGLTNKCNLRCEICGSQKHLDATGISRRHMDIGRFEAVAQTLFPLMAEIELNSQGDPLLHPHIERVLEVIGSYRCDLKVQTNGTLLSDRVIDLLVQQTGIIMLSLDAVGPRFDEVRRGGVWARAKPGLEKFLRRRDPARLGVGIYPTVTRRTLGDALAIVEWAREHDVDEVAFHRYQPIRNSFEEAPTPGELAALSASLSEWITAHGHSTKITLDGNYLSSGRRGRSRTVFADPVRRAYADRIGPLMAPMERTMKYADPAMTCVVPDHYVEIGLEGQISACCRAQDVVLGFATSPEEFAKAWFGANYRAIRQSLMRNATGAFPLPNCEGCIEAHAPDSRCGRRAVNYAEPSSAKPRLDYADWSEWVINAIQMEAGHCHIAMMSPGLMLADYQLFENERPLGPANSLHDDIRQHGEGRYSMWGQAVYFSTSDNSDARYNGRSYVLRRAGLNAAR
jgi:MoaA/NifB/PqqE/SkfB family radical SAM enzyme